MCITLGTGLLIAMSAASAGVTAIGAQQQAAQQKYQMAVQNQQLEQEKDMTRLRAQQQEAARLHELTQMRARNDAFLAGSGVDENQSYLQGADPYNERELASDLGTLRLNTDYQVNRIADQIAVNRVQSQFATTRANYETLGGIVRAAGSIAGDLRSRYNSQNYYKF